MLKLNDFYEIELAKSLHQLYNQKLPQPFGSLFTQIERIHNTRQLNRSYYSLPKVDKTACQKKLSNLEFETWSKLSEEMKKKLCKAILLNR